MDIPEKRLRDLEHAQFGNALSTVARDRWAPGPDSEDQFFDPLRVEGVEVRLPAASRVPVLKLKNPPGPTRRKILSLPRSEREAAIVAALATVDRLLARVARRGGDAAERRRAA
jgi:hypothetical protein